MIAVVSAGDYGVAPGDLGIDHGLHSRRCEGQRVFRARTFLERNDIAQRGEERKAVLGARLYPIAVAAHPDRVAAHLQHHRHTGGVGKEDAVAFHPEEGGTRVGIHPYSLHLADGGRVVGAGLRCGLVHGRPAATGHAEEQGCKKEYPDSKSHMTRNTFPILLIKQLGMCHIHALQVLG